MIALSKLASTNLASHSTKESFNNPIITQALNKPQGPTSSNANEFRNNQIGKFLLDAWIINETDFSYSKHIVQNKLVEAIDGSEGNNPAWTTFMVGVKVGQIKLILVRNNGKFMETRKQGNEIPFFLALEIKVIEILPLESVKKETNTSQQNTKHEPNGKIIFF